MDRRLAAIFAADVVGYSRLMGDDEAGTLERLKSLRKELMKPKITERKGRIVKLMGDGLLAEFPSVVEAVQCAVEIQRSMIGREGDRPEEQRIRLRIGVNLGDVIIEGADIYGDGVNIAARLEAIADPGGVCISEDVHRQVKGKMTAHFLDLGEQDLKNIDGRVRAYSVSLDPARLSPEAFETLTGEPLDLPEQPSIAVLPFENMSGDPEQEFFADGITEDIITALSRVVGLIVMARTSSFAFKGQAVDVRQVGTDLGVRYVLEGSIRRAGNRIRLTGQLIDAQTGSHIWAERYDRELDNIFALQDEITREIVVALAVKLTHGEELRVWADVAPNLEAWELMLRAMSEQYKFTREGNLEAQRHYRKAIALDPDHYMFKAGLGWSLMQGVRFGFAEDPAAAIAETQSYCDELLKADDANADAHALQGYIEVVRLNFDAAIASSSHAVELRPNVSLYHAILSMVLSFSADYEASLNCMRKAMRLSPYCPDWYLSFLGDAYRGLGDLNRAQTVYEHLATRMPDSLVSQTRLAVVYSELGDTAKARNAADTVRSITPLFSAGTFLANMPFRREEQRESFARGLREAGLPD